MGITGGNGTGGLITGPGSAPLLMTDPACDCDDQSLRHSADVGEQFVFILFAKNTGLC